MAQSREALSHILKSQLKRGKRSFENKQTPRVTEVDQLKKTTHYRLRLKKLFTLLQARLASLPSLEFFAFSQADPPPDAVAEP